MNKKAELTRRETEIAELFAWGASKKDISEQLYISERTVETHTRTIYEKVGCKKVNELSAWWFCTRYNISLALSPLKRRVLSIMLLMLIAPQMYFNGNDVLRAFRTRTTHARAHRARRKTETDAYLLTI